MCWVAAASLVALGRVNGELSERECVSSAGKLFNLFLVWLWLVVLLSVLVALGRENSVPQ